MAIGEQSAKREREIGMLPKVVRKCPYFPGNSWDTSQREEASRISVDFPIGP
jgi:hypothetical protein